MWETFIHTMKDQFANNDLFAGGAILMVAGAFFAIVRGWPLALWSWIKKQSMVVIDIPDKDPAFAWMIDWLAQDRYAKDRARLLTVNTSRDVNDRCETRPKVIFSPAPGTHFLWYKRRFMILTRERENLDNAGGSGNRDPFREYFTIRILGRGRHIASQLLDEARDIALPLEEKKIQILQLSSFSHWEPTTKRTPRNLNTIILKEGLVELLIEDIEMFLQSRAWYVARGIPYRRGYLFQGPPGNGKSSAIVGLATHFNFDIGNVNLRTENLSDAELFRGLSISPPHSLVLMEDIDCVVDGREIDSDVTFSGLLNAIDGVGSPEGQIVIMTTNHIDQLDPALIRPGRCDVQIEFGNADIDQAKRMFNRFYPTDPGADEFIQHLPEDVSMAQLQGYFLKHRDNHIAAVQNASTLKEI